MNNHHLSMKKVEEMLEMKEILTKKVAIQQNKDHITSAFQPLVEKGFRSG
jgi:hypothetical protein